MNVLLLYDQALIVAPNEFFVTAVIVTLTLTCIVLTVMKKIIRILRTFSIRVPNVHIPRMTFIERVQKRYVSIRDAIAKEVFLEESE